MLSAPENSQCHIMKLHSLLYLLPISLSYTNLSGTISPNFNITVPLKIIVHGFGSSCYRVWTREMRLSLLAVVRQIFIRRNTRVSVAYSRIFFKPHGKWVRMLHDIQSTTRIVEFLVVDKSSVIVVKRPKFR